MKNSKIMLVRAFYWMFITCLVCIVSVMVGAGFAYILERVGLPDPAGQIIGLLTGVVCFVAGIVVVIDDAESR